jgi:hypothetical protein
MLLKISSDFFLSREQLEMVRKAIDDYYDLYISMNEADVEKTRSEKLDAIDRAYRPITLELEFELDPSDVGIRPIDL